MRRTKMIAVDTTLGTHLLLSVSRDSNISDLRDLINKEHLSCFPGYGEISIGALMVKYGGKKYHVTDSLLVGQVFRDGLNKVRANVDPSVPVVSLPKEDCRSHHGNLSEVQGEKLCVNPDSLIAQYPEAGQDAGCQALSGEKQDPIKNMASCCPSTSLCQTKENDIGLDSESPINEMLGQSFCRAQENFGCPLLSHEGLYTQPQLQSSMAALVTIDRERPTILRECNAKRDVQSDQSHLCCMKAKHTADADKSFFEGFGECKQTVDLREEVDKSPCSSGERSNYGKGLQLEYEGQKKYVQRNSKFLRDSTGLESPCVAASAMLNQEIGTLPMEASAALPQPEGPKLPSVYCDPNSYEHSDQNLPRGCSTAKGADKCISRKECISSLPWTSKSTEQVDKVVTSQGSSKILSKTSSMHSMSLKSTSSKQEVCNDSAEDLLLKTSFSPMESNSGSRNEMTTTCNKKMFLNDGPITSDCESLQGVATQQRCTDEISRHFVNKKGCNTLAPARICEDMVPETQESQLATPVCHALVKDVQNFLTQKSLQEIEGSFGKCAKETDANVTSGENLETTRQQNESASTRSFDCLRIQPLPATFLGLEENLVFPEKYKKQERKSGLQIQELPSQGNHIIVRQDLAVDVAQRQEENGGDNGVIETCSKNTDLTEAKMVATDIYPTLVLRKDIEGSFCVQEKLLEGETVGFERPGEGLEIPQTKSSEEQRNNLLGQDTRHMMVGGCQATTNSSGEDRGTELDRLLSSEYDGRESLREEDQYNEPSSGSLAQTKQKRKGSRNRGQNRIGNTHINSDHIFNHKIWKDENEIVGLELEKVYQKKKKRYREQDNVDTCHFNNTNGGMPSKFRVAEVDNCASNCSKKGARKLVPQHRYQELNVDKIETSVQNVMVKLEYPEQNTGMDVRSSSAVCKVNIHEVGKEQKEGSSFVMKKYGNSAKELDRICSKPVGRVAENNMLNALDVSTLKMMTRERSRKSSNPKRWVDVLSDRLIQSQDMAKDFSKQILLDSAVPEAEKADDQVKETVILSPKAGKIGVGTPQQRKQTIVGAGRVVCPVGCGRRYSGKTSAFYRHKNTCSGKPV